MTSTKAGYLFMNRSAIDEDAGSEVLKILELERSSLKMSRPENQEYNNLKKERNQKGIGHCIIYVVQLIRVFCT